MTRSLSKLCLSLKRLSVSITVQKTIDLESESLNIELISDLISYFIFANFLLLLLNKVEKALSLTLPEYLAVIKKCKFFKVTQAMPHKLNNLQHQKPTEN